MLRCEVLLLIPHSSSLIFPSGRSKRKMPAKVPAFVLSRPCFTLFRRAKQVSNLTQNAPFFGHLKILSENNYHTLINNKHLTPILVVKLFQPTVVKVTGSSIESAKVFNLDLDDIYLYSIYTFGIRRAKLYENEIWKLVEGLSTNWPLFSECRHLPTKSKKYRGIILESHLIIYRITDEEIQVLRIVHSNRSITKIRSSKRIMP